jgi:hypothetical protein
MTRIEQRPRLRREKPPSDAVVVVRGGRDTIDKLRRHAERTAAAWQLDGEPLYGVSIYCALDEVGPASLRNILADMHSYPIVHLSTIGALVGGGFEFLATASRPHFTVRLSGADDDELHRLLALFGQPRENTFGKSNRGRR